MNAEVQIRHMTCPCGHEAYVESGEEVACICGAWMRETAQKETGK